MKQIETVGVCGSGVMGSQLAALFAGAGFEVLLFDLKPGLAAKGVEAAARLKPAAFYHPRFRKKIATLDYDAHLERLGECDWVLEAIAERLDWKTELYARIAPHLAPHAVLSTNTSGLPPEELAAALDDERRRRFLVTHFFNPPRYMQLVELVPVAATDEATLEAMEGLLASRLGKGVVRAKPTPNFIANRIGIHGMMLALELTREMRLSIEQVDAITGVAMGRPKSATYRTADLVGLDVLASVAATTRDQCPEDEALELFADPPFLAALVEKGWLGQKSGGGFYKKEKGEILALDLPRLEYRPRQKPRMDGIGVARRQTDIRRRLAAFVYNPDLAGRFAWELVIGNLAYAARRLGEIADDVVAIDRAMRWGFGWQLGPFQAWDAIGVEKSARRMRRENKTLPPVVDRLLGNGEPCFYRHDAAGARSHFDLGSGEMRQLAADPDRIVLAERKAAGGELRRNWSASLVDLGDGVGCVEFHSALQPDLNPIDGAILDLTAEALAVAGERGMKGLVMSHDGVNFSAGANLALILELAKSRRFDLLEAASRTFQDLTQLVKYAPVPVVAAPFGLCLGGGFEMVASCREVVALAELYCGAVEVGVGLIPGAGGNLRVLTHQLERHPAGRFGPMVAVQKAFETIAFAKVSRSAEEAKRLGYLRPESRIVLSRRHQIALAKELVLTLSEGYRPPQPPELPLPGQGGKLAMRTAIKGFRIAGKISKHDALIANGLAHVLTGGSRASGSTPVDEQYLLDLEREVFVSLAGEEKSQARMEHMLKTGKPLRN